MHFTYHLLTFTELTIERESADHSINPIAGVSPGEQAV